jgi:hypothetical protein
MDHLRVDAHVHGTRLLLVDVNHRDPTKRCGFRLWSVGVMFCHSRNGTERRVVFRDGRNYVVDNIVIESLGDSATYPVSSSSDSTEGSVAG